MINFKRLKQFVRKIIDKIFSLIPNDLGIDLGTATTLVYVKGEGVVLCEPSVVAIDKNFYKVLAVGDEAKRMLGRTPGNILAIRPMKDGVITDFEVTEAMLRYFIKKAQRRRFFAASPRIVIAVPSGITEVERRAVKDSAERAGTRAVYLVEEPIAAAIGVGLPIQEPIGNMIIDIGGGTTEIAVISLGGIVFSKSIRIGGDEMDEAIIEHLKKTYNLMIGERSAEEIKIKIGSAYPLDEELTMEVKGRDLISGLPKAVNITSEEIREALQSPIKEILETVKISLERTPPELASDLIEHGVMMAGGGALLRGLDKLISEETGLPVHVADDPLSAVAEGTGKILNEMHYLKKIAALSQTKPQQTY
ncbi:MAG: rod shape-determining protein [Candidatus Omnitrophica bacterium]|nr:rod shape-determining protein [Candidatus Omnitrophota bacterium]